MTAKKIRDEELHSELDTNDEDLETSLNLSRHRSIPNARVSINTKEGEDDSKNEADPDQLTYSKLDYDSAFELTGYGCMNRLVLVTCCLIFVYCSQEMTGIAYIITPAECDLQLNVNQKSLVNSGIYIGVISSAVCWGSVSDRYGRRKVMLPAMIGSILSSFLSSLSTSFLALFLLRCLTGVLVSASSATVLVYLSELHSKKHRNRAVSIAITSDQINFVIFPGIAWMIIPGQWSFNIGSLAIKPWRVFMWLWGITGLIGTVLLFKLPESPRFLLATKGSLDTIDVLGHIFSLNLRKKSEEFPVKSMKTDTQSLMAIKNENWRTFFRNLVILVRAPLRRCFLITHFCLFMVNLLSNGLYMWMPDLINETLKNIHRLQNICQLIHVKYMSVPSSDVLVDISQWSPHAPHSLVPHEDDDNPCSNSEIVHWTYIMAMLTELLYLFPYIAVIVFINKCKPANIYGLIMMMCAVSLIACCVVPHVLSANIFLAFGLCSGSCASILSTLTIDAFPTKLRALAMCTMFMMGQLGTIVGICLLSLMNGIVCQMIFFGTSFLVMGSVVLLVFFWPDMNKVKQEMKKQHFSY